MIVCFYLLKNQVKGLRFDTNVFTTITHGRYSLQVIFLARMYWAGKKSWVYKPLNKILNAEIIFMNGDINNLVIPVIIVVVGDVLLLITIIEYICIAECGRPRSAASAVLLPGVSPMVWCGGWMGIRLIITKLLSYDWKCFRQTLAARAGNVDINIYIVSPP